MSRAGAPMIEGGEVRAGAAELKVAVVAASWHAEVMRGLREGARQALDDAGVGHVTEVVVPGTFELPVAASRMVAAGFDAVVALGVVVRGGTPHFDYVCDAATSGLTELAVRTGVPIGFGVLTCDNDEQAYERSGLPGAKEDKGYEAAMAAVTTAVTLKEYPRPRS